MVKRPRSVVRTKNADLFFRLLPLCSVQGQGQGSSQLRYATRDATGSRGGSIGSVHARARRHRDRAPWSSSGDRESRAGRMASHVTAIMNAALSRARRSGPVLASDQRLRPLAVWLMPPETLPSACLFAGNGEAERRCGKCGNEGSHLHQNRKNPHATQINPAFLPACLWLPFECGTSFVGNHGLLEYN